MLLHNIRSLHNVGSILRTADAVGVEKLYLCGITPSPLDRLGVVRGDIAKTALGAEKKVAWEQVTSTSRLINKLKQEGFTIVALELDKRAVSLYDLDSRLRGKIVLIVGAEVEGIPQAVLKKCDTILEIPMVGSKESLNVAVAFGIAAFHLRYGR